MNDDVIRLVKEERKLSLCLQEMWGGQRGSIGIQGAPGLPLSGTSRDPHMFVRQLLSSLRNTSHAGHELQYFQLHIHTNGHLHKLWGKER